MIAESIADFFAQPGNVDMVNRLKAAGLRFEIDASQQRTVGDKLKGLTFVVSGGFKGYDRDGVKEAIERNGGKVSGSISKKTSFVLAGADMGPAKRAKADELGVKVIDEAEMEKIIQKV